MKKRSLILIMYAMAVALLANDCVKETTELHEDCAGTICTMEFRSVIVQVKKLNDSTPVQLTDYKVILVTDDTDITPAGNGGFDNQGSYQLINDSHRELLRNRVTAIEFRGYLKNTVVVTRRYNVTADCCHIYYISGDLLVYI